MINDLNDLLDSYKIRCSNKQLEQFDKYFQLLIDTNKKINLTTITDKNEVTIKHFFDSITPAFYINFSNQEIIDIGTGAGFPGIPLKILFPDLKITLLDSLGKRTSFLHLIKEDLNLGNLTIVHGRAEDVAKKKEFREAFDFGISRAVARLNVLSELTLPFVKKEGLMIALKGSKANEEITEAAKALTTLGGAIDNKHTFTLPNNSGERTIIIIKKIKDTPSKYPRKPGDSNRDPII